MTLLVKDTRATFINPSLLTSNVVNHTGHGLLSSGVAKLLDKESWVKILGSMTEKVEECQ